MQFSRYDLGHSAHISTNPLPEREINVISRSNLILYRIAATSSPRYLTFFSPRASLSFEKEKEK